VTGPTQVQLAQERDVVQWCRDLGDHQLESEFCSWIQRRAGRQPGSAIPTSSPSPRPTAPPQPAASAPSCGCPTGDRQLHQLARRVIDEQLGRATPGCWQCAEIGRQCPACEAVARQNRYPEAYW
jgi:hypothetical protein